MDTGAAAGSTSMNTPKLLKELMKTRIGGFALEFASHL